MAAASKATTTTTGSENMAKGTKAHPGFKAVEARVARESGVRDPGAVVAAAARNASPEAKKANPRLKRVKG